MTNNLQEIFDENPIIAGIKDDHDLEIVLESHCKIVFILYGSILNISNIVDRIKSKDKIAFINVDLIEGFSSKEVVIQYLKENTHVDGILSSKPSMVKVAKNYGFLTIHRLFLIDSFSYHNIDKQVKISQPDCIEVLPGCMPKVISWIMDKIDIPIIAGGLVCEKEDVVAALGAGAVAISSTNTQVWSM